MRPIYLLVMPMFLLGVAACYPAKSQTATAQEQIGGPGRHSPEGAAAMTATYRRIGELNRQGEAAVAQGKYAQGEALFRKGLSIRDNLGESWLLLADVCERQGKQSQALQAYDALFHGPGRLSSEVNMPVTRIRYALALTRAGRWQEAVAVYERTVGISEVGQYFDARVVERARLQAAAHLFLAPRVNVYVEGGARDRLKHLQEAVRLAPRWALAHYKYGEELARTQRLPEARTEYSRAASLAGGDLKPQVQKALEELKARENRK
jgi:tetratricopeptide (TPR) repeat protein